MQLYQVYTQASEYSDEARVALNQVIEERGGIPEFLHRVETFQSKKAEANLVYKAAKKLIREERDFDSVKASLPSHHIPEEHIDRILTTAFSDAKKQKEEMSTSSGTVVKGLIATLISSILAGALLTGVYL